MAKAKFKFRAAKGAASKVRNSHGLQKQTQSNRFGLVNGSKLVAKNSTSRTKATLENLNLTAMAERVQQFMVHCEEALVSARMMIAQNRQLIQKESKDRKPPVRA